MSNYEATKYDFTGANLTGIEGIPTGCIIPWSDTSIPTGFLECNGQAVSRSTYATLSEAQLASHTHSSANNTNISLGPYFFPFTTPGGTTGGAGSGTGHSHNMSATFSGDATAVVQPYLTILYVIKT